MKVELELWHLIGLLITCAGACWAVGQMFFTQFEKRLSERFNAQEAATAASHSDLRQTMQQHLAKESKVLDMVQQLEREFLTWRAELPNQYVRREDYIRNQTIIESKLDTISSKMEILQLKGKHND
ncbi:hypothetical protein [Pseudoduganella sp. RAF53_2]|uniref:hypothetical protein n=1 Tax=unclassified Pseudoduganella TaxID=2637179 RepID=UPI003F9B2697